ncbi:PREDICTED: ribosome biogenesis [Prunus dulcis]|uniref:PREDICTED: ribosome biogenesis n=1 Tax=Prunus dulcis TaxID=3755 RepID=A0A5E4GFM9_PRUDU|nr:PREDICTED: ribosome biogenesis [Prunus dulcis]
MPMAVQVAGLWLPSSTAHTHFLHCRSNLKPPSSTALSATASLSSPPPTIQIVGGGRSPSWYENGNGNGNLDGFQGEDDDWCDLDTELYHWTKQLRPVQWYPGHIAKTEKELKNQLKLMDVVIEVRDARIPMSTSHPQMDLWLGNRKRVLVLNREDMISTADRNAWATYFAREGTKVVFSNGKLGMGAMKLGRLARALAADVNVKRRAKGLLPRAVRAGIVGYPNVGKSSLINRLLKRRMCAAAPRPGVTRELKWVHFGKDLELLDSPGILPMRISDQTAAIKLAICDDIGERSYGVADIAAVLVQMLMRLPSIGVKALNSRYKMDVDGHCGKTSLRFTCLMGIVIKQHFECCRIFGKGSLVGLHWRGLPGSTIGTWW